VDFGNAYAVEHTERQLRQRSHERNMAAPNQEHVTPSITSLVGNRFAQTPVPRQVAVAKGNV